MTMYDKLGRLLSEALENGELPLLRESKSNDAKESFSCQESLSSEHEKSHSPKKKTGSEAKKSIVIPQIPERVKSALSFISIPEEANYEEAKKLYREKLMYYHPDRRNDNPVLQKVAKEKTERLLKEWEILERWYQENQKLKA